MTASPMSPRPAAHPLRMIEAGLLGALLATLVLAEVSLRLVERPVRRHGMRASVRALIAWVTTPWQVSRVPRMVAAGLALLVLGTAVAIVREDEVVYLSVHGARDIEAGHALTSDTRFPLASVTKSVTAMSVALLVDDGLLGWDTPVREYVPELVFHDDYVTQHVTVRDMLSHRTGLPRHDLSAWRLDVPRSEYVKRLRHLEPSATFREKFQYNNLMYYSAAHLVETVAGSRWEDFVQERIFTPLDMAASNFQPEPPLAGQLLAKGYRPDRDETGAVVKLIETQFGAHTELSPGAAGALFSTLDDLVRWLGAHVNHGRSGDTQLVSAANLQQMHLPHTIIPGGGLNEALFGTTLMAYGMGWMIQPYRGLTVVQHGGNVEGHSLMIGFVPRERIGVIVLTNLAGTPLRDALLYESIDRALGLDARDWSARLHQVVDPMVVGRARSKTETASARVAEAPMTHSLADYAGTFQHPGYPPIEVEVDGEALRARLVGSLDWAPLTHHHYDVFEWDLSDFEVRIMVRYLTDDRGELGSISLPIESAIANLEFTRAPVSVPDAVLDAVVGRYPTPVEGMAFTVSRRGEKMYVAATGGGPREMTAYRHGDDLVGFRVDRERFDFERRGDSVERLVYHGDGITLHAEKGAA